MQRSGNRSRDRTRLIPGRRTTWRDAKDMAWRFTAVAVWVAGLTGWPCSFSGMMMVSAHPVYVSGGNGSTAVRSWGDIELAAMPGADREGEVLVKMPLVALEGLRVHGELVVDGENLGDAMLGLNATAAEVERTMRNATARLGVAELGIAQLNASVGEHVRAANTSLDGIKGRIDVLNVTVRNAENRAQNLSDKLDSTKMDLQALANGTAGNLTTFATSAKGRLDVLEESVNALVHNDTFLRGRLGELDGNVTALKGLASSFDERISNLTSQLPFGGAEGGDLDGIPGLVGKSNGTYHITWQDGTTREHYWDGAWLEVLREDLYPPDLSLWESNETFALHAYWDSNEKNTGVVHGQINGSTQPTLNDPKNGTYTLSIPHLPTHSRVRYSVHIHLLEDLKGGGADVKVSGISLGRLGAGDLSVGKFGKPLEPPELKGCESPVCTFNSMTYGSGDPNAWKAREPGSAVSNLEVVYKTPAMAHNGATFVVTHSAIHGNGGATQGRVFFSHATLLLGYDPDDRMRAIDARLNALEAAF